MSLIHVGHSELVTFADDWVNLPKDKADEFRAQARRLREKLEAYLGEHPDSLYEKCSCPAALRREQL